MASGGPELAVSVSDDLRGDLETFAPVVRENDSFLVAGHVEPDGDAIGSTLGLAAILESLGNEVVRYNRDPVPHNLEFLEGAGQLVSEIPEGLDCEATIVLDTSERDRIGALPERGWAETVAVIDHHDTWDDDLGGPVLRETDAAATAQLVYHLADWLGHSLSRGAAEALYCGLMTDTGSFRYSNTSSVAFRVSGELLAAGVDPWEIACKLYEQQPVERVRLLAEVLDTLRLTADGKMAFLRIDRQMVEGLDRVGELTDGFINYGRSIDGVEVSIQLRELEGGRWQVSFRSKGEVDVSTLAAELGGGGHANAAGCRVDGRPEAIETRLTEAVRELL